MNLHIKPRYLMRLCVILLAMLTSCGRFDPNKKLEIYSDTNWKPVPKIDLSYYKSPQLRSGQTPTLALGISIAGGGTRAQYFGTGVLIGLDEIKKDTNSKQTFLKEIDYFSTVSGGGWGAGYYLTLDKFNLLNNKTYFDFWKSSMRKVNLKENLYKSAEGRNIITKFNKYEKNKVKLPYPLMIDQWLLQVNKGYGIRKQYLSDYQVPKDSVGIVKSPMFVPNGTIYNNAERIPFMTHILNSFNIVGSYNPENNKNFGEGKFPLSYAIAGSAAVPGVLPMLKLKIKDKPTKALRIIDGGAVDNLGYNTLFELLHQDSNTKRALIVECAGLGRSEHLSENEILKRLKFVEKTGLYSVDINLMEADKRIEILSKDSKGNQIVKYKKIGFFTIKNKFQEIFAQSSEQEIEKIKTIKNKIQSGSYGYTDFYRDFLISINSNKIFVPDEKHKYNAFTISEIPSKNFKDFNLLQVFTIFELAAQVETKVKIGDFEKQMLVLAGRYAVYLEQNDIHSLLLE